MTPPSAPGAMMRNQYGVSLYRQLLVHRHSLALIATAATHTTAAPIQGIKPSCQRAATKPAATSESTITHPCQRNAGAADHSVARVLMVAPLRDIRFLFFVITRCAFVVSGSRETL